MTRPLLILFCTITMFGCSFDITNGQQYSDMVGDIEHDAKLDKPDFLLCNDDNNVYQYFNMEKGLQFEGEKIAITQYFNAQYKPVVSSQSGWIRVRFIVNCKGETGRFRMMQADENFLERTFDPTISDQIMALTQTLKGWKVLSKGNAQVDYYQYLAFKINNGDIEMIMP